MDISQLCSDSPNQSTVSPFNENNGFSKEQRIHSLSVSQPFNSNKANSADIKYLLSSNEQNLRENKSENANNRLSSMLSHCGQLCDQIQHLRSYNATLSIQDRDILIDKLSTSANSLFKALQAADMSSLASSRSEMDIDKQEDETEDEYEHPSRSSSVSINKEHAEYDLIRQARNLQNTHSTPKYRRRNRRNMIGQKCHSCNTTETPEWRRGPDGARTLCNACGLHYSKLLKKGSIGVQTHNYLINSSNTPRLPAASASATHALPPSPNFTDIHRQQHQQQQTFKPTTADNASALPKVNFPFVLMNPKYGTDKLHQRNQPLLFEHFQQQQQYPNHQQHSNLHNNSISEPSFQQHQQQHSTAQYHSNYTLRLPPVSAAAAASASAPIDKRNHGDQPTTSLPPSSSLHPVNYNMNNVSNSAQH